MNHPTPDQRAMEELWRKRLQDAKLSLDFARNYLKEIERDLPLGDIPAPDGTFARLQGLRAEQLALVKYRRVLRTFTDLVMHGIVPDEAEWQRQHAASAGAEE